MRAVLRLMISLGLLFQLTALAFAGFDESRAWFDALPLDARSALQTDLVLLGYSADRIDGSFGQTTFEAITAFQRAEKAKASGVLGDAEREKLAAQAAEVEARYGFRPTTDSEARAQFPLAAGLLTEKGTAEGGASYYTADDELSVVTARLALDEGGFAGLFDNLSASDSEREVLASHFDTTSFAVEGIVGGYHYRTQIFHAGDDAVGYTVAWGDSYAADGPVLAAYLASNFVALPHLLPKPVERAEGYGAFSLPDDNPDVIVLNAEIGVTTAMDFDRALAARPEARTVVLNSQGGIVDGAIAIARKIHRLGLRTYVPDRMGCYSACAYIFFAGTDRQARGELGVHQISAEVDDLVFAQTTLGDLLDALQEFGVAQPVISHMLRTPPQDMYVFSPTELKALGINHGAAIELAINLPQAAATGDGQAAFVELSSLTSFAAASRARDYFIERYGNVLGDTLPRVDTDKVDSSGAVYRVRVPAPSVERAKTICDAIKTEGGGCYVQAAS